MWTKRWSYVPEMKKNTFYTNTSKARVRDWYSWQVTHLQDVKGNPVISWTRGGGGGGTSTRISYGHISRLTTTLTKWSWTSVNSTDESPDYCADECLFSARGPIRSVVISQPLETLPTSSSFATNSLGAAADAGVKRYCPTNQRVKNGQFPSVVILLFLATRWPYWALPPGGDPPYPPWPHWPRPITGWRPPRPLTATRRQKPTQKPCRRWLPRTRRGRCEVLLTYPNFRHAGRR